MADPLLYAEHEVLKRLKLRPSELEALLNAGIIAPVARRWSEPMYCAATIDALATDYHHTRMDSRSRAQMTAEKVVNVSYSLRLRR